MIALRVDRQLKSATRAREGILWIYALLSLPLDYLYLPCGNGVSWGESGELAIYNVVTLLATLHIASGKMYTERAPRLQCGMFLWVLGVVFVFLRTI